jgi:tetratricopeptide (TPR) repeat protein
MGGGAPPVFGAPHRRCLMVPVVIAEGLAVMFQISGYSDGALIAEAQVHADRALDLNPNNPTVLFQVANTCIHARKWEEGLTLAQRAVDLNPSIVDARHALAAALNHFDRYDEALAHLAEAERAAPGAWSQMFTWAHRSWAYYAMGRMDEALDAVDRAMQAAPGFRAAPTTRAGVLQAMGLHADAQDMIRMVRRLESGAPLDWWINYIRGTYMSETMAGAFVQHFVDAWNATPEERA